MSSYRFIRTDVRLPPAQLNHLDLRLDFRAAWVDGEATLTLTAREPMRALSLDAQDLQVLSVTRADDGAELVFRVDAGRHKLVVDLGRDVQTGETFVLCTRTRCVPSQTHLEGLYYDVSPAGAPPQIMSQCQQWGFQRIVPVIDDCTAKCTFRTTLEADGRYTHLISNGNADGRTNPDGHPVPLPGDPARQTITYVNTLPMAPYLFIACVGTWEVLADQVTLPTGRSVRLEYLVPPGRTAAAAMPMAILKDAVLWQHRTQGYTYPHEVYRTICMEKSNYGGMENVGNTTILTEAALIDDWTLDSRLIYAHGVIVHEFEHNQCGSDVTMASPFDMWLNEAFTVDVERQFLRSVFNPDFLRLREVDAMRAPGSGPLATEDGGQFGQVVREGFNDPGELVDGLTYVKAAEIIAMLRLILGPEAFRAGVTLYFTRHHAGNADTDQFFACFTETSGRDLSQFRREWLHTIGYPRVTAAHAYDDDARRLTVVLRQSRSGRGGDFHVPVRLAAVTADGRDIPGTAGVYELTGPEHTLVFDNVPAPAFLSYNRSASFYGTFADHTCTPATLRHRTRSDPDAFNRVDALRTLTELERTRLLDAPGAAVSPAWLDLYREQLADASLPDGLKSHLLHIDEQPLERAHLPRVRACYAARRTLLRAAAAHCRDALHAVFEATDTCHIGSLRLSAAIERRALKAVLMELLSAADTPAAQAALARHLRVAVNPTDRLNTVAAIYRSTHPERLAILDDAYALTRTHLGAYSGYLQIVGQSPHDDVFERVALEVHRAPFSLDHPSHTRSLFVPLSLNNAQFWTPAGLAWLRETAVRIAPLSEHTTLRIIAPCQQAHAFEADLRAPVLHALRAMRARIDPVACPSVCGRLDAYLTPPA